ncbi:MAG: hypothetical protein Q8M08_00915 [Bacteroidales bacterium]|nr:hypothetical protein [Bacteroidales bacterium]
MKTSILFYGLFLFLASGLVAQELTLDQIMDKYYEAGNFKKLSRVNSIIMTGFMLQKRLSFRLAGGKEITVENFFRDYRKVDGIPFAFTVATSYAGRENEIQFGSVELNKPVDLKIFSMAEE